jgi:hypothetical protein
MHVEMEDLGTGWYQIYMAIKPTELDSLIELLQLLKNDQTQHFHLSSDYEGEGGIGDIEFSIQGEEEIDNMMLTSPAIRPNR